MKVQSRRIDVLDAARLVAAVMVVFFHWYFNGMLNGKVTSTTPTPAITKVVQFGYWGVTFFFLISGFVISRSMMNKTPGRFLAGRVTRLFPLFWFSLAITSTFALTQQQPGMTVTWKQILLNTTMVPSLFGVPPVDGAYWTLEYEWLFYITVFALIVFKRDKAPKYLEYLAVVWLAVIAIGAFLPASHLWNYNSASFLAGAMAGRSSLLGWSKGRIAIFSVASVLLIRGELANAAWRLPMKGLVIAALLIVCFLILVVAATFPKIAAIRIPLAGWAGRMTYPLYLLHAHNGYMLLNLFGTAENQRWLPLLMFFCVLLLAWGLERLVDGVLGKFWKRVFYRSVEKPVDRLFLRR